MGAPLPQSAAIDTAMREFAEEFGHLFEETGAPASMGRVIGRLLLAAPDHQSLTELATYLGASKGAVSTITRQLLQGGFIVKVPVPGSREVHYRLRDNAWMHVTRRSVAHTTKMREHAEKAVALVADRPAEERLHAEEMLEFYRFYEAALPRIFAEWLASKESP